MATNSTQQQRFQYLRKEILGFSQKVLAEKLGLTQQNIADIESGRKQKLDSEVLFCLLETFGINTEWLLFGTGNISKEEDAQEQYNKMSDNIVGIPFYNCFASAGSGEHLPDFEEKDLLYFDKRWLKNVLGVHPNNLSIIKAKGDSMDGGPRPIKDGDLLLIDTSKKEGNNNIFVFKEDGELFVKKLCWHLDGSLDIISHNPLFPIRKVEADCAEFSLVEIIGKVVWNGSKESV